MLTRLRSWLRAVLWRSHVEREMDAELRWHFDQYIQHLIQSGLSREEAQRRARLDLGDIEVQKDKCRDSLGLRFLDELGADFRFALRSLRKHRWLATNVVITLTFGIGVSSGVFNFLDAIALRADVAKGRDSYVEIFPFFTMDATRPMNPSAATLEDYLAIRDKTRSLREFAACARFQVNFDSNDLTTTRALLVSSNFFSLYGLEKVKLGRLLQPEDYAKSSPVVVLSEDLWRDRFAANPSIVGKTIHINEQLVTAVGVAPRFASGRNYGEAWFPYTLTSYLGLGDQWTRPGEARWLSLAARLNPGFSRADATAELALLVRQQDALHKDRISKLVVTNGSAIQEPGTSRIVWMVALIMGVLMLVLIISCANVTTLLLSRADARQREMGVRLALGASRARLIRMLVTETVLLASVAGVASIYLAYRFPVILWLWIAKATRVYPLDPDWRVFFFLAVSTVLAGTLAGLAPALESLKVDLLGSLKGQRRFFSRRSNGGGLRNFLVATQVAISLVLLVGSVLFVRAHHQLLNADPGYETRQVILTNIFIPSAKTPQSRVNFRDNLTRQIEAMPGVRSTALASNLVPSLDGEQIMLQLPGKSAFPVASIQVSANYFATMSIPILRGRALERNNPACGTQSGVCPVVVSQQFAREFLNDNEVIGKTLRTPDGGTLEIVGIAGNVSPDMFTRLYEPAIYRSWSHGNLPQQFTLLVRATGNAEVAAGNITDVLRKTFPGSKVEARTLRSIIYDIAEIFWRLEMLILLLGVMAVFLAVIGIYGVVSFAVSKRTKEIGIRVALGAMKKDIYVAVIGSGMRPIWIGLCVGIPLAIGGARILQQALKPVASIFGYNDPLSYAAPACLLLAVSVIAMLGPAYRAAACDPSKTLREE